jgi:hypothetical protein
MLSDSQGRDFALHSASGFLRPATQSVVYHAGVFAARVPAFRARHKDSRVFCRGWTSFAGLPFCFDTFSCQNNLSYQPISEEQFEVIEEQLKTVYFDCSPHSANQYYPVPFQEATQLLK